MAEFNDNNVCFVCGDKNPIGLKLRFQLQEDGTTCSSQVVFQEHFQGWHGIVHGGLISTVLDEMVIQAAGLLGIKCVTGELTVKFSKPAKTGDRYLLEAEIVEERGRLVRAESRMLDEGGTTIASATGKLIKV